MMQSCKLHECTANAALDKPASQSTTFRSKVAANAVDNDETTSACTKYKSPEPWWSVDLGEAKDVSCVCVTNDNHRRYG